MMKIFLITLEADALEWFYNCSPKEISPLLGLIEAFHRVWDFGYFEGSHEAYVMVEICCRLRRKLDDLVLPYQRDI